MPQLLASGLVAAAVLGLLVAMRKAGVARGLLLVGGLGCWMGSASCGGSRQGTAEEPWMALWAPEVEVVPRRILWPPVLDKDWRTQVYVVNPFGSPLVVEGVDVTCGCLSVVEGREMVVPPHAAKPVTVGGRGRPSPSGERMWVRWRHGDERGVVVAAFVGAGRAGTAGILARPTPR